ncbi:hypothetical protein AX17_005061 [Amanita inopinata Kibby_2008]|nr:hypothetical protein AX17_005061 [Amanita inopinata Kibby_2008]
MSLSRKRKQRSEHRKRGESHNNDGGGGSSGPDPALFVVAYEADIIRGPRADLAAQSLEVVEYLPNQSPRRKIGGALIKWGGSSASKRLPAFPGDEDDNDERVNEPEYEQEEIWVDRYDARLLLDSLPSIQTVTGVPKPESPGDWSDLPSDAEDTFFLSPTEAEDYQREKRRRTLDRAHEERLKARMAEDEDEDEEQDVWGASDEEPDDDQRELMRRTAIHLSSSPNAAQLEMRILANHGADKRFAFLRGRWSRTWKRVKGKVRLEAEKAAEEEAAKKREAQSHVGLGALAGYGDSDAEEPEDNSTERAADVEVDGNALLDSGRDGASSESMKTNDAAIKEARRQRARLWAENRRRALQSQGEKEETP